MLPTPAPMPAAIMMRRSRSESLRTVARKEPKPAPIWAMGPSRPPDPPVVRVMAEAMVLIDRHPAANVAPLVVVGMDGGVGAVPFGFRREGVDQPAAENPPMAGRNSSTQRLKATVVGGSRCVFTGRHRRPVAGHHIQEKMDPQLAQGVENDRAEAGDQSNADKID
jgi:hypothetical protein